MSSIVDKHDVFQKHFEDSPFNILIKELQDKIDEKDSLIKNVQVQIKKITDECLQKFECQAAKDMKIPKQKVDEIAP